MTVQSIAKDGRALEVVVGQNESACPQMADLAATAPTRRPSKTSKWTWRMADSVH